MDFLRQAAQMALEAWDRSRQWPFPTRPDKEFDALRAALAQPEQEPVAYQWLGTSVIRKRVPKTAEADAWQPLYTAPPQRKPLRTVIYACPICAASLERQE